MLFRPIHPVRDVGKPALPGLQASGCQGRGQLLYHGAWRGAVELAVEPEPDLAVVHGRCKMQMDIPASFRRGLDGARQVQPAGRVVGDEMLDIPDELSPVTRFDKRPVVPFRGWQGLPAVAHV